MEGWAASHKDTHTHTVVAVLFAYVCRSIVICCVLLNAGMKKGDSVLGLTVELFPVMP